MEDLVRSIQQQSKQIADDKIFPSLLKIDVIAQAIAKAEAAGVSRYYLLLGTVLVLVYSLLALFGDDDKEQGALDEKEFRAFKLIEREEVSHDVRRFRFALQHKNQLLGLPIGQHITLRYVDAKTGEEVQRSYTPVSSDDERGYVDFVIKVYKPWAPKFPEGGKMSQHLDSLAIGDSILMRGPRGELEYLGNGKFRITHGLGAKKTTTEHKVSKLGLIAGGTGITVRAASCRPVRSLSHFLKTCPSLTPHSPASYPIAHASNYSGRVEKPTRQDATVAHLRQQDGGGHPVAQGARGHSQEQA
jgi:hypothetical protein